jgi:hypothetical protein
LVAALLAGCGGHSRRLGDGQWYGRLVSVDVTHRRLTVDPACNLNESGSWTAVKERAQFVVALASHPELQIYVRPGGDAAAGHGQKTELTQFADTAAHDPAGWFVALRDGAAVSVEEDSGIRSSGKADKRTFACVWSTRTQAFVRN